MFGQHYVLPILGDAVDARSDRVAMEQQQQIPQENGIHEYQRARGPDNLIEAPILRDYADVPRNDHKQLKERGASDRQALHNDFRYGRMRMQWPNAHWLQQPEADLRGIMEI